MRSLVALSSYICSMVIAATAGVSDNEQGLASGLFNTTQQVGAGLVLAIAVSSARTAELLRQGEHASKVAITAGLQYALYTCVGVALLVVFAALVVIREKKHAPTFNEIVQEEEDHSHRPTPDQPISSGTL
ncbi:MAG: hypothetical protein ACR2H5_07835 [Ktedonobacteraceae bacterium]